MPENRPEKTAEENTERTRAESRRRVLDEQRLVNEREKSPGEFGGMAHRPVDSDEPPVRPEVGEETQREDLEPETTHPRSQADIERQGS